MTSIPLLQKPQTQEREKGREKEKAKEKGSPKMLAPCKSTLPSKTPQSTPNIGKILLSTYFISQVPDARHRASSPKIHPLSPAPLSPSEERCHRGTLFARKEAKGGCAFTFVTSMHRFISFVYLLYAAASFVSVGGGRGTAALPLLPLRRCEAMPI